MSLAQYNNDIQLLIQQRDQALTARAAIMTAMAGLATGGGGNGMPTNENTGIDGSIRNDWNGLRNSYANQLKVLNDTIADINQQLQVMAPYQTQTQGW